VPWARGGATALDNLCSLCRRHHACVHEYGFRLEAEGARGFRFFRPDGREVTPAGATPPLPAEPVEALRAQHRADGLAIDAWTSLPDWDGQAPDYDHAVFCLLGEGTEGRRQRPAILGD